MYINFQILTKNNFNYIDNPLLVLQLIKQKHYELLKDCPKELLNQLYKDNYIQLIEGKPKEEKYMKVRLSDKGKNLLKQVEIQDITDEAVKLAGNLVSLYLTYDLTIKNKKQVVSLVSWFLAQTGFAPEKIYNTVNDYVLSTEKKYVSSLNNLLWKGESVFSNKWDLSQSKLYALMTKE